MSPEKKAAKPAESAAHKAGQQARQKAAKKEAHAEKPKEKEAIASPAPAKEASAAAHAPKAKPKLDGEARQALGQRREKKARTPRFRRHEWWRYKRLGGRHASWRLPRGIHSKTRRHFNYRPPLVSIGYRGPAAVRGLHPSGFEEVLVHNPEDLAALNKETQAARVGGTVGGRKAERIEKKAAELGIRILNPRGET